MSVKVYIDYSDAEELFRHIFDISEDADLQEVAYEYFEDDPIEVFREIVSRLLPMADVGESPLTGNAYRCFSVQSGASRQAFVKTPIGSEE